MCRDDYHRVCRWLQSCRADRCTLMPRSVPCFQQTILETDSPQKGISATGICGVCARNLRVTADCGARMPSASSCKLVADTAAGDFPFVVAPALYREKGSVPAQGGLRKLGKVSEGTANLQGHQGVSADGFNAEGEPPGCAPVAVPDLFSGSDIQSCVECAGGEFGADACRHVRDYL